jgi:hypothetical protein
MVTVAASPGAGGLEKRTFECLKCHHVATPRTAYKIQRRRIDDMNSLGIDFKVGDRFKLSALGSQRCPRLSNKGGIITSMIENSRTVCVRFDGNKY